MARISIEIAPLCIQVDGPLALSTGFQRGLIQRTVEKDSDGLVYIPGSSLKGRVRGACEQLAQRVGLRICRAPRPAEMCSAHKKTCLVCRIFGSPGLPSSLYWRDARMSDAYRKIFEDHLLAQTYARTQVQLSRVLGIAASDHLFTSEFAVEDLQFTSSITGWLEVTPIAGEASTGGYELLLLLAGLRMVNTIGGNVSRGAGWIKITVPDTVSIDNQNVSWREMLEYVDLLGEFDEEIRNA